MNGIRSTVEAVASGRHANGLKVTVLAAIVDIQQGQRFMTLRLLGPQASITGLLSAQEHAKVCHLLPADGSPGALRHVTGDICRNNGTTALLVTGMEVPQ